MNSAEQKPMPKIKKIIFLHEHQFTDYYYHHFGIDALKSFGYAVEVWNFALFLQNNAYLQENIPCTCPWDGHVLYDNKKAAVDAILKLTSSDFVICGIHYTLQTLPVYRALAKSGILCASFLAMALPLGTFPQKKIYQRKIRKLLSLSSIRDKIFSQIPFHYFGVHPVNLIFAMGEKYLKSGYPSDNSSEILWLHSFDYDLFLQNNEMSGAGDQRVGVFLDEYLPYHSDNTAAGLPHIPAEKYYAKLRQFFDYLEDRFGVKIMIAAHPRSQYEDKPGIFGNRPVICGKTLEFVKQSGFVIIHQSMSLNFAVLYRKPLIFTITDDTEQYLIEDPHPQWLADYFGKKLHNLDREFDIDFTEEMKINDYAYRTYKNDFIKKQGSEELPFWQIVARRIEQYR